MQIHELKTDPVPFSLSFAGLKPFEVRFDDRHYQIGDMLILRETKFSGEEMKDGKPLEYTGRVLSRLVSSKVDAYGMQPGWVILGVEKI